MTSGALITAVTAILCAILTSGGIAFFGERFRKGNKVDYATHLNAAAMVQVDQWQETAQQATIQAEAARHEANAARTEAISARREAEAATFAVQRANVAIDQLTAKIEMIAELIHDPTGDPVDVVARLKRMLPHPGGGTTNGRNYP